MQNHRSRLAARALRSTATVIVVAATLLATAGPVASGGAQVTRGEFTPFADAEGDELGISGRAQMVRTSSGDTKVVVHVTGLEPGATYGSHVHDEPCDTGNANGHYFFAAPVPEGDGPNADEIWPGPVTANRGGVASGKTTVGAVAGPEAVSVVIHRSGGAKIACADLS
ncbi:MAG: hypothetical protein RIE08_00940 [Acidimicrobiales bacterium]